MRRNSIIKSIATVASALLLAVGCSSDPDVVASGENDAPAAGEFSGTAAFVDEQTIRITASDDIKFEPMESLSIAQQLAKCFEVNVSCEQVENAGTEAETSTTVYSASFEGYTLSVDVDGSLLLEVENPYLSSSDVIKLTYRRDSSIADLKSGDGDVLASFSYAEVEGSGDGSLSYEVAQWSVNKTDGDGSTSEYTGTYPIEYIKTTTTPSTGGYTFTDLSNSGDGRELYVKSAWINLTGVQLTDGTTSVTVSNDDLNGVEIGLQSLSLQSIFTRPVYAVESGVRIYSHKVVDGTYKGLYQLDKNFIFKVYPETVDAKYKLFWDESLINGLTAESKDADGGGTADDVVYSLNVGDLFYMNDQTYPTSGAESSPFDLTYSWVFDMGSTLIDTDEYELDENETDLARAMFYAAAVQDTYVKVTYTVKDDRSTGKDAAKGEETFYLSVSLDPTKALYTAEITTNNTVTLSLASDATGYSFPTTLADDFNSTFIARRIAIATGDTDYNTGVGSAEYYTKGGSTTDTETIVELRSDGVEIVGGQLVITFPQKFYTGETFSLIYDGHALDYTGAVSSVELPLTLTDGSGAEKSLITSVPIQMTSAAVNLTDIPEVRYRAIFTPTDDDFKETETEVESANKNNKSEYTLLLASGSTSLDFNLYDIDSSAKTDFPEDIDLVSWSISGAAAITSNADKTSTVVFSEGQSVITVVCTSNRPSAGISVVSADASGVVYKYEPTFYSCEFDAANYNYKITKQITVNSYPLTFASESDITYSMSSDAAGETAMTLTTVDSGSSYVYDNKADMEMVMAAGDVLYVSLDTFGIDGSDFNVECTSSNSDKCTITRVDSSGATDSKLASSVAKIVFSETGNYSMKLSATRPYLYDPLSSSYANESTVTYEFGAYVISSPLGVTLNYNATSSATSTNSLYFTIDNGSKFISSGVDLTKLASALKVYYDDSFTAAKQLEIKSVAFGSSDTRLQITLLGGINDRMYGDDDIYVTFDGSVALPTTDTNGRSFPVLSAITQEDLDAEQSEDGYDATSTKVAAATLADGVPNTLVTSDDSFDFDNLPYQYLQYTSTSAAPESGWSFGTAATAYTEAAVVDDPTGEIDPETGRVKRCIKLIADPKISKARTLYNGTHLKMYTSTVQYNFTFKVLIPKDVVLDDTTNAAGNNLRPSFALYVGSESNFTGTGSVSATSLSYANYSAESKINQWQTQTSGLKTVVLNSNGTPDYNRVSLHFNYYNSDVYVRDISIEMRETRP